MLDEIKLGLVWMRVCLQAAGATVPANIVWARRVPCRGARRASRRQKRQAQEKPSKPSKRLVGYEPPSSA